jgi:hypothetical protein
MYGLAVIAPVARSKVHLSIQICRSKDGTKVKVPFEIQSPFATSMQSWLAIVFSQESGQNHNLSVELI